MVVVTLYAAAAYALRASLGTHGFDACTSIPVVDGERSSLDAAARSL
jgi:hypothetical protein